MTPRAYYNEIDPYAAQWLRNLIAAGHIAPGDVDERSITDVQPADLAGYTQCHFFAGIGVWSHALRSAGWDDARPVWTGSCPCQPFSAAGKRGGTADERHLWPHLYRLISACRPVICFGEQVASSDGLAWLDVVQTDLEAAGYASGAVDTCAAGFGAPHIRQRLYWVAYASGERCNGQQVRLQRWESRQDCAQVEWSGGNGGLANANQFLRSQSANGQRQETNERPTDSDKACGVVNAMRSGFQGPEHVPGGQQTGKPQPRFEQRVCGGLANAGCKLQEADGSQPDCQDQQLGASTRDCRRGGFGWPSPTRGFWRAADWLWCRDHKWRAVEPGTFPLAHGATARVGRLRAYGNAIVAPQAAAFVTAAAQVLEHDLPIGEA